MAKNDPDYWEGMANLYLERAIKAEATIAKLEENDKAAKELIRQILDDRLDNDADIGEWKEKANKLLAYENKKG